jgi:hypothetical protein
MKPTTTNNRYVYYRAKIYKSNWRRRQNPVFDNSRLSIMQIDSTVHNCKCYLKLSFSIKSGVTTRSHTWSSPAMLWRLQVSYTHYAPPSTHEILFMV